LNTFYEMKHYSQDDIRKLKELYHISTKDQLLLAFPGRTWSSIYQKARSLGLIANQTKRKYNKHTKSRRWSHEEIELLKEFYPIYKTKQDILDRIPGRSFNNISYKARKLGIKRQYRATSIEPLSPMQIEILKQMYPYEQIETIMKSFPGKSWLDVQILARSLGLRRQVAYKYSLTNPEVRKWTDDEIQLLKDVYQNATSIQQIKDAFPNRSWGSITGKAVHLGIKRLNRARIKQRPRVVKVQEIDNTISLNISDRVLTIQDMNIEHTIRLKPAETKLLRYLMDHKLHYPNSPYIDRVKLHNELYPKAKSEAIIDIYISHVRKKVRLSGFHGTIVYIINKQVKFNVKSDKIQIKH
jgi:hypothetical protein